MQTSALWILCALLIGCATPARLVEPPPASDGDQPILVGAHGPLSPERSRAMLDALAHQAGGSDLLVRHERSVQITNAYFVPDEQPVRAIEGTASRGLDVSLAL